MEILTVLGAIVVGTRVTSHDQYLLKNSLDVIELSGMSRVFFVSFLRFPTCLLHYTCSLLALRARFWRCSPYRDWSGVETKQLK
jgi:hypothetical protein